ncbi:cystathionine beta-lyase [Pseudochrobactrum sp. sp1633]|uniref:cystathionine beta-lyase n=1 Tax=Pseudochrobactrum sp. sp1633 TaxID=3036706 RepID=UPI0025A6768B|nr:cystathionine beta-lyase [Pseudochrobactrum sp. sp1633]MDM8344535.1 cystathionine beta-lyase [Pseudochrobactrum sp. sp1633]HWD13704.1 cystathionine beta-lyase [Pseudochrobactrum sp.]
MVTSGKATRDLGINTILTHCGNDPHEYHGFVNPPVVRASTVLFPDAGTMASENQKYTYGTHGTPTTDALCNAIDQLEGSAGTLLVPSGLAAVSVPLLAFLKQGDHILFVDTIYHPTRRFANSMLKGFGIEVEYYPPHIGADIATLIRPNTRVVFTESPGSNTFEIQDIPAIVKAAHAHDIVVMMDNTWATPLYFKALDYGVDITIHAGTKYPSGHSDVLFGMISANEKHWKQLEDSYTALGMCVNSDDAYQILRGLRSMGLRLNHHQQSALTIARWLEQQPQVARVLHPALESHPDHALWKRDFKGASGVFSIVLASGGKEEAHKLLDSLKLFGLGYSWGGYESLAVHVNLGDRTVAAHTYEGPVIRLQIGLEDTQDLINDLQQGLTTISAG